MTMNYQKDRSGFTPQERHDIILKTLDEFGKTTKCFQLRWRENSGELLDVKVLSSTPMFWYMKYKWSRNEIETLFFKARCVIDPVFDMSLQQTFGGAPGPRWKGGGGVKKSNWKRTQYEMQPRAWISPDDKKKQKDADYCDPSSNDYKFQYNPVNQPVDFQATGGVNNNNNNNQKQYGHKVPWDPLNKNQNNSPFGTKPVKLKPVPDYSKWTQPTGSDIIPIYVECPDGKTIKCMVRRDEPIHYVKKQIETQTGIPENSQKIFFNGLELTNNDYTLKDYNIDQDDILQLSAGTIKVFIEKRDGNRFEINVDPHSNIGQVKQAISSVTGLNIDEQKLFKDKQHNNELEDPYKSLFKYNIHENDVLYLGGKRKKWVQPTGNNVIPVFVETPDGKILTLNVTPQDPIGYVKLQIASKTNGKYPVDDQNLFFNLNELDDDDKTIADNGIKKNDVLQLSTGTIPIFVETRDGKIISLDVDPHEKISNVKEMIKNKTGVPVNEQKLFNKINNQELNDPNKSLHNYGVTANSTLYLGGKIPIRIQKPNGDIINMEIDPNDKIADIKKQIQQKDPTLPANQQTLTHANKDLSDQRPLKFYGVKPNDLISLKLTYPIYIKKPDGNKVKLNVSPTDTVAAIKSRIEYSEDIPVNAQTLSFKNKELTDDDKPLTFYNINENAVLDLDVDNDDPEALLEKILNRDSPYKERERAMNKIHENLGKNPKYDVLLQQNKIPLLLCGYATQVLDEDHHKNPVAKTAIQQTPDIFKQALDKGNPSNIAIGSLQETLDSLFKIYDDPKCSKLHPYARKAIDKIVDDIIAKNDPKSIVVLAGVLTEKTKVDNINTPIVRKFAMEQLQKIMFPKDNKLIGDVFKDGAKMKKVKKVEENDLPQKPGANRQWLDVGTNNAVGPVGNKPLGDEYRDIVADAISEMILDPNRDNTQIGLNIADIFNQLNPDFKKRLDGHARNRYQKWSFGPLKDYKMKMPPPKPKKKYKVDQLDDVDYRIKQQTNVGISAPTVPDL